MTNPQKENAPVGTGASKQKPQAAQSLPAHQTVSNPPPAAIRELRAWLVWRYVPKEGSPKPDKMPFYANGVKRHGTLGSLPDRRELTTYAKALEAATRGGYDGVGFALLKGSNVVALDFDHCVTDGVVHPAVERLVAGTYAELSPSGAGVRAFMWGDLGNHKDLDCTGPDEPFGFEVFSTTGYVTFTGNALASTEVLGALDTVAPVSDAVRAAADRRFNRSEQRVDADPLMAFEPRLGLARELLEDCLGNLDPDLPYPDWCNVGMALHHETEGGEEGYEMFDEWSSQGRKYAGPHETRSKYESFGNPSGRPVTARTLLSMAKVKPPTASPEQIEEAVKAPIDKPLRFQVVPAGEFAQGQPPGWIVKGVIPRAQLVVLFGESGSGKSFVALDIAAAIVRGTDWRGHRTKRGRVVYLAAEGGGGFRNRLRAYEQQHKVALQDLPLGIIHAAPNFLQRADAVEVAKAIEAAGGADLVIVDTFAQVTPGANENAAEDMGKALAHCRGIHQATSAVVLLVHHAGKDPTRGARGWSGLRAAADAELEVLRLPGGRLLRVSKQKDGDDGLEWGFDLETVPVGLDEDGDVVLSCVVRPANTPVVGRIGHARRAVGKWERLVLEVVGEIALGQNAGIEVDQVLAEVVRRSPPIEDGRRDTRKQVARRALLALCEGDEAPYFLEGDTLSVLP